MLMTNLVVARVNLGEKCSGTQYTKLYQASLAEIGEVKTAVEAKQKFYAAFDRLSAGFHTGASGRAKYSAPFLAAIDAAFAPVAPKSK